MRLPVEKRYGSVLVRPARQADFEQIGESVPYRTTAITGEEDGKILGIGGISWLPDGRIYLFAKLLEAKKHEHAVVLHIAATKFLKEVARAGVKHVVARPDPSFKGVACEWMYRLGLRPTGFADTWSLET